MTQQARGTFKVELKPLPEDDGWGGFARLSIDKRFEGDLAGESKGVMLAAHTEVKGSAGYVACERVTAELAGKRGSFVLQHYGMMGRGEETQTVAVVTDSGTGGLKGLVGTMEILRGEEGHGYVLTYSLPEEG
ncbi:MAG: DUF3224 domain-containing protein [Planctomycetota bacterium]